MHTLTITLSVDFPEELNVKSILANLSRCVPHAMTKDFATRTAIAEHLTLLAMHAPEPLDDTSDAVKCALIWASPLVIGANHRLSMKVSDTHEIKPN